MPKTKSSQEIREAAETTYRWHKKIEKQLCGKKIVAIRYMTPQEAEDNYWDYQPIMLILDDGTALCPAADDELNNAGSLVHFGGEQEVIPVMRERI